MGLPHPTREEISENPFPRFRNGVFFRVPKRFPGEVPRGVPGIPFLPGGGDLRNLAGPDTEQRFFLSDGGGVF
ncbi:MAG: hypothetical protein C6P37_11885 [Caldibacillus debilis]|uniref:Uncharacterized protein n=1 Tax=Caldibacillus debilis TaxID=301148 RepID=A0A3E0K2J2_9BACI|nr:MAG: hypothetical protein BAA03_07690 [Caldibacillus debilis]REJ27166.1 MAG: hypothetical protein C6P37_11885 [Caldibacillus debilis]